MATLNFTVDEALNILWANGIGGESIKKIKTDRDGLLVTVAGGIGIGVRQESFACGILKLAIASKSWAFKMADALGKIDEKLDEAIRDLPYIRREGKSLFIDLNSVLQGKVKGIKVKNFELQDGLVKIEF